MHFRTTIVLLVPTLLSRVFSIPVTSPEHHSDISLSSKRNSATNYGSLLSVARDIGMLSPDLVQRDVLELFERNNDRLAQQAKDRKTRLAANKQQRKGKGTSEPQRQAGRAQRAANKESKARDKKALQKHAVAKAQRAGRASGPKVPTAAKITFGKEARKEMNKLGLHGKSRKHAKNYHKAALKQDMERHGAATGTITHIAHSGGSDPKERFHMTAQYKNHHGQVMHSHHVDLNGIPSSSFHVYPEDQKRQHPKPAQIIANENRKAAGRAKNGIVTK